MATISGSRPEADVDLFTDDALADPFPLYREIRDAGQAVYLPRHGVWAMGRYDQVREALHDWETYSSAEGTGLNPASNQATRGLIIATDPPEHDRLRDVLSERLSPRAIRQLTGRVGRQADELVAPLVARGAFDAVGELARALPVTVVLDLIGLPLGIRDKVLDWADGAFNAGGPAGPRTDSAYALLRDQFAYLAELTAGDLAEGSMGRAIYDAAAEGRIDAGSCVPLLSAYVTAGLDTTINAISSAVHCFAARPDQWDLVRADPGLIPRAFNEVLRVESPIQWFARVTTRDVTLDDGTVIPCGDRVMMLYASANRDERQWRDPDRFDITRPDVAAHLAFGYGTHACSGMSLARLEGHSVLHALARRVERFETGPSRRRLNNRVRGLDSLPTTVTATREDPCERRC